MDLQTFLNDWNDDNPRLLVHTSGSTGQPKPLWVEKRRMVASARMTCDFLGLRPGDTALLCLSLDYIAGKMMVVRSLERGLRMTAVAPTGHPLASPETAGKVFSLVAMVPLQVYNTLQDSEERDRLQQVRHLIIGGGAIDDGLTHQLKDFPNNVWSTYGMTETLSHIALRRLSGVHASEWYEPFSGVSVSVNGDGCLVINAPYVCSESLVTNDIAEMHGDGRRFRILGRKDNVVCSGGLKIQIEEVERLLRPHITTPFLITRRPDPQLGEALVMLTEATDTAPLQALCQTVLPKYWLPRDYMTVKRLPLTETGKPARREAERMTLS